MAAATKKRAKLRPKLPKKLSAAMRVALADLAKCEADPRYKIDMGVWHEPTRDGKCAVCLAGSTLAQTCKLSMWSNFLCMPSSKFHPRDENMFSALNDVAFGNVERALEDIGLNKPRRLRGYIKVTEHRDNPKKFRKDMERIAAMLERHGL